MLHALANTLEIKISRQYSLVVKCVGLEPDSLAGVGTWYTPSSTSLSHNEIIYMMELSIWHIVRSSKM